MKQQIVRVTAIKLQISNFLSILCLSAPLREKNSPPTAVFRLSCRNVGVGVVAGIVLAPVAASCGSVTIEPGAGWTPIAGVTSVQAGSVLDFSGLCSKREIAGAYGRVIAKGPHFEFEKLPGVKQRFYGVNRWDSARLSRIFRDNLSRIFTRPPKTLGEKYFRAGPRPVETFRPSRPGLRPRHDYVLRQGG